METCSTIESNRVNDTLINKIIPVTFHVNLLTLRDTDRKIELVEFLIMMTNENYSVDLANLSDTKIGLDFTKGMHFDGTSLGKESTSYKPSLDCLNYMLL